MSLKVLARGQPWFARTQLSADLTAYTEPYLYSYFRSNFFHLKGRDLDLVIDTGMGLAPVKPALDLTPGKPLLAVVTHCHADHVGGLHEFDHRAGPSAEAELFGALADDFTFADEFRELDDAVTLLPREHWTRDDYLIRPAELTRVLLEGDRIDLGDRSFTVLELPGHSFGSIGLFDEADGTLFSGDVIHGGELIDNLWSSNREDYRRTMQRLIHLPVRTVHGGHGDSLSGSRMLDIARAYLEQN